MSEYILSIDQGTTGTTTSLYNLKGEKVREASQDFKQIYPKPGWVEHNPEDIWKSVTDTMGQLLDKTHTNPDQIKAIGITNQRETIVVWDRKSGEPIYNAIVWQCRRTTDFCEKLKKRKLEKKIRSKTGLVIDPYFSASKVKWILDNVKGAKEKARRGELAFGTIDSFLLWKLTGGKNHATDVTNASRTQLMNIKTGKWDKDLLKIFGVYESMLPEILASAGVFGHTHGLSFLPNNIPISGILGDQQSALFGQACYGVGDAKCTYGTGSFLLLNIGNKFKIAKSGTLTTVAWKLGPKDPIVYAFEGSAFVSGAAVQWIRDGLEMIKTSGDIERLAASVPDTGGVEFVPALTGLGAPYWAPEARGLICGITRGTTKEHIARATLEGIALQNMDLAVAMQKDLGKPIRCLKVDGGASANNLLMQLQADYLGLCLERPENLETTSAGAAFIAAFGAGLWKNLDEVKKAWRLNKKFEPKVTKKDRTQRIKNWHQAVTRVL